MPRYNPNSGKPQQSKNGRRDPALCKNPPWRPRKITSLPDLETAIDAYFDHCDNTIITRQHVTGKGDIVLVDTPTPYTMAGLAYYLDMSKETLNQLKYDTRFSDAIMRARKKIEVQNITGGLVGVYESKINALNLMTNFGYRTKADTEIPGGLTIQVVNYSAQQALPDGATTPQLPEPDSDQYDADYEQIPQDIESADIQPDVNMIQESK